MITGKWSDEELDYLIWIWPYHTSVQISAFLERSPGAIRSQARKQGLPKKGKSFRHA